MASARLLGKQLGQFVAPQHRSAFSAQFERAAAADEVQTDEILLKRNGLSARHAQVKVAPLPQSNTERKRVEESLRMAEERWKRALEASGRWVAS